MATQTVELNLSYDRERIHVLNLAKFSTQDHDCKLRQALVLNLELGTVLVL